MSARGRFATGAGTLAASAVYLVTTTTRAGLIYYLPTRHSWTFDPPSGVIAMDWFARSNATLLVGALVLGLAWRFAPSNERRLARLAGGLWALAATLLGWGAAYTVMWLVSRI